MPKFMLILQSPPDLWRGLSADVRERKFAAYKAWNDQLRASGRYVTGEKLAEEGGKALTRKQGRLSVIDGPYAESKEVVGGYVIFRAADYAEAVELVRDSPFLDDYQIAIRQTDSLGCGGD